jgi:hypothetical protein
LIVQWGATLYSGTTLTRTSYLVVFPNAVGCVVLQNYVVSGSSEVCNFVYSADKTGFTPASKWGADNTVTGVSRSLRYMAIGY